MKGEHRIRWSNLFAAALVLMAAAVRAQQPSAAASNPTETLKVQTRLVLVDTIVTDKKGNYIRDLEAKDFKVWEDGKEQGVTSFSREDNNGEPSRGQKHYMVLFFDNSTMEFGDQAKARGAASKFIDANGGSDRLIAIAEFGGTLRIAQNFTADMDRLKKVVAGVNFSTVSPNGPSPDVASAGIPTAPQTLDPFGLASAEADFGARSLFLAIRSLAKGLAAAPGRKTLVLLSSGFVMDMEMQSELNAVIDACNKANVAVYPIDVRGLVAAVPSPASSENRRPADGASAHLIPAALTYRGAANHNLLHLASLSAEPFMAPQHGGGGGGGHGGGGGPGGGGGGPKGGGGTGGKGGGTGGTTGGRGGSTGTRTPTYGPINPPRPLIPQIPDVAANQQFLYQLAEGTGGFVIVNTNDLLGGMDRIAKDQSEYYLLGYKPPESPDGSCHTLKVKVDRGGTNLRFRNGYCKVRPQDLLAGTTTEKDLETRASGEMPSNVTPAIRVPYFYYAPNVARVHLAMEIPAKVLHFEKVKGKQHAEVNVLGIAYKPDGSVAARFSDTANLDFDGKKEMEEYQAGPFHYEKQFEIGAGTYNLRVAFNSGNETFGKVDTPLNVAPYDGKKIAISAIVLSNNLVKLTDLDSSFDSEILQDAKPLVVLGMQVFPSATNQFKKAEKAAAYVEVYDPLLAGDKPPEIRLELRIVDKMSGAQKLDTGFTDTKNLIKPGNPTVPVGLRLPLETLTPGSYRIDLRAQDSLGNATEFSAAEFKVE